jgi:hypothetical protein
MNKIVSLPGMGQFEVHEVVGVFSSTAALSEAVEQLGVAGFDRASISVLGLEAAQGESAAALADDKMARRAAYISPETRTEGQAVAIAVPLQIGGFASAWAVAAAGGALTIAIGATVVGGAAGAGLGALLYGIVARRHARDVERELSQGGVILWVTTPDAAAEARAIGVLQSCQGRLVHAHVIDRHWGVEDSPLHRVQPDPFLESEPCLP